MKSTLPAITGSGYEHLDIRDGTAASREFLRITFGVLSNREKMEVRRRLEEYCTLDTMGMVKIVDELASVLIQCSASAGAESQPLASRSP